MTILRRNLLRLWILCSLLWLAFIGMELFIHGGPRSGEIPFVAAFSLLPPLALFLAGLGLARVWEHFGRAHWLRLPEHLRKGLTRLYLVVAVPWVAWYGYQISDAAQRSSSYASERAMSHAFWSLLIVPIGGPVLLLVIMWVLAGFRKSSPTTKKAEPAQKAPSNETVTSKSPTNPPPDLFEIGRRFAIILMDPDDCWRDVCKLREYKAPGPVATCEMAFARAAIIRDAITRCQPEFVASQMLAGVDQYVAEVFASEESAETLEYYEDTPLSVVAPKAIRLYEKSVFYLPQLADVIASRLSVPGLPVVEIAPLFEEVAAEAERLMKVSSALQKLKANLTSASAPTHAAHASPKAETAIKKQPTMMDAFIKLAYGNSPSKKTAKLQDAIELSYAQLLGRIVDIAEVRSIATQLYNGPIPYSTHDLAVATALNLFRSGSDGPRRERFVQIQIFARMVVLDWMREKKVVPLLAESFEDTLYERYKPRI
jgi:hypothetical protein